MGKNSTLESHLSHLSHNDQKKVLQIAKQFELHLKNPKEYFHQQKEMEENVPKPSPSPVSVVPESVSSFTEEILMGVI